jgi:hypothetical protein
VAEVVHGLPLDIADSARGYLTDDLRLVLERFETVVRARVRAPIGLNSS